MRLSMLKQIILQTSLVVISVAMLSGCGEVKSEAKEAKPVVLVPVQAEQVITGDIDAAYGTTATLEAAEESEVFARQTGVVTELLVEEGDEVSVGQILAQLETEQLELELRQAEANLKQMANDLARQKKIYKQNLVSSEDYEKIAFQFEAQKAQTDLARLNLEHATIRAPISGVIASRHIKLGNMLKINQSAFHISNLSELHAIIHLPESEKADLQADHVANIWVAASDTPFVGHIERISPVVDSDTGTIRVTVSVKDQTKVLRPGMFGRVGVIYDTHQDAMLVPKTALVTEDNVAFVFTIADGKANKKEVELGFSNSSHVEIVSGINLGDQVITMGQRNIKDQAQIEIIAAVANL